jgi:hypothetical protein
MNNLFGISPKRVFQCRFRNEVRYLIYPNTFTVDALLSQKATAWSFSLDRAPSDHSAVAYIYVWSPPNWVPKLDSNTQHNVSWMCYKITKPFYDPSCVGWLSELCYTLNRTRIIKNTQWWKSTWNFHTCGDIGISLSNRGIHKKNYNVPRVCALMAWTYLYLSSRSINTNPSSVKLLGPLKSELSHV